MLLVGQLAAKFEGDDRVADNTRKRDEPVVIFNRARAPFVRDQGQGAPLCVERFNGWTFPILGHFEFMLARRRRGGHRAIKDVRLIPFRYALDLREEA